MRILLQPRSMYSSSALRAKPWILPAVPLSQFQLPFTTPQLFPTQCSLSALWIEDCGLPGLRTYSSRMLIGHEKCSDIFRLVPPPVHQLIHGTSSFLSFLLFLLSSFSPPFIIFLHLQLSPSSFPHSLRDAVHRSSGGGGTRGQMIREKWMLVLTVFLTFPILFQTMGWHSPSGQSGSIPPPTSNILLLTK